MLRHATPAFLVAALLPSLGRAGTVTLTPVKDNSIYADAPSSSNGLGPSLFCGTNAAGTRRRALLQFDIAGNIPPGSVITSVQLTMQMDKTPAPTLVSCALRRVLQDWGEGASTAPFGGGSGTAAQTNDATWTNAKHPATPWTTAGGSFAATTSVAVTVSSIGSYTWASTPAFVADVQSFLDQPGTNFGWILIGGAEIGSSTAKRWVSRNSPTAAQHPRLVVDFTAGVTSTPFCFGDGTGTACPCANNGIQGRGCANSAVAPGGLLQASGAASVAGDTLVLSGAGMPNATAIYFQGTTQLGGGAGTVFGDGLWCAGGALIRLGVKTNAGGVSSFPGTGDPSVSVQGLASPGSTRHYQIWYADTATFCTSAAFNFTNALSVTWN